MLEDVTYVAVKRNQEFIYTFGETFDPEETLVTLEINSVLPEFMTFEDGKLTIGPLLEEHVGTYEIETKLTDEDSKVAFFKFKITI